MAKKGRSRRDRNFVAIPFTQGITLSTLGDNTLLSAAILTFGEDFYCVSADLTFTARGMTSGEGPVHVGLSHGDLTDTEILEAVDASVTDPDDIIAKERSRRPVRKVGAFQMLSTDEVLNNGVPIRRKVMMSVGDGHSMDIWALNRAGQTLTTGGFIQCEGTLYGRWQR